MKSINKPTTLAILFTLICSVSFGQSKNDSTIIIKTKIYCDHCLDCGDCGGKLIHDLSFVKGIKKNILDPRAMALTITFNPSKITSVKLREEISKLGYDADDIKADPAAYQKLDGCCKKPE